MAFERSRFYAELHDTGDPSPYIYIYMCVCVCVCVCVKKNEMGGACGAYGGWERCAQGSDWKT